MKFSAIRSGAAAVAAALSFAACAGHGIVPSGAPVSGDVIHAAAPDAASPCPIPGFAFGGPCAVVVLKKTGGTSSLKAYKNISVSSKLSAGSFKSGQVMAFQDATGKGDIGKYKGKSFPLLKGAFLYLAALNTGAAFTFNDSPGITITNTKGIPGKTCTLSELSTKGKWTATPLPSTVKGKTLAFAALPVPGGQAVPAGAFYLAFACK